MLLNELNPNNIDFSNPNQVAKYEEIFKKLLQKETFKKEEINFINTFLSKKIAFQHGITILIENINLATFIEEIYKDKNLNLHKEVAKYCKILGMCTNNETDVIENDEDYTNAFFTDNYIGLRNNRASIINSIIHESKHAIQCDATVLDNHYLDLNSYLTFYNHIILQYDYQFYSKHHDAFYIEKDATLYSIIKTIELLTYYNEKLTPSDQKALQYELEKMVSRDSLKDQLLIAKKGEEIIKKNKKYFQFQKAILLEFNPDFTRKTIDQIIEINKIDYVKTSHSYLPIVTEELFDYLVYNAIKLDENAQENLQKLTEEQKEIVNESLKRSVQTHQKELETLKIQLNYHLVYAKCNKLLQKINKANHLVLSQIKAKTFVTLLKLDEIIEKEIEKQEEKLKMKQFELSMFYITPKK